LGNVPALQGAVSKEVGTRFEQAMVESVRHVMPETAAETTRELLRGAITAAPGFTLRGGTNEILRGLISRELIL
jgi:hypothetical protein